MTESDSNTFGRRLRALRESAGLTQVQLAEKAGLHSQGVVKLERGERAPVWATVQSLAKALGVDCTAFTDDAAPSSPPPAPPKKGRPPKPAKVKPAPKPRRKKKD